MEFPNPIFQSSQFSLLSASNSQVLGSLDSLSLPSEPPDIGNWFPSYRYESLKLETSDIFGGSICEETEIEKDKDFFNVNERANEESVKGLKELEKKAVEVTFQDENCEQYSGNVDSWNSLSLPSEPIHLRNWFPNYEYESPSLDTSDGFRDSVYKERECEYGLVIEDRNREKLEDYGNFKRNGIRNSVESSDKLVNSGCSSVVHKPEKPPLNKADTRDGESSQIYSEKSNMCSVGALKHCSEYAKLQNHGISTAKDDPNSDLDQGDSQSTVDFSEKPMHRIEIINEQKLNGCEEDDFSSSRTQTKSTDKSDHRCYKENDGNKILNDGFVTTRKNGFSRGNEEKRFEAPKAVNSLISRKDSIIGRKALAEKTNFQHSSAIEITGKWQCPPKRKPYLGPPLKQLRLERWVQRL